MWSQTYGYFGLLCVVSFSSLGVVIGSEFLISEFGCHYFYLYNT